MELTVVRGVANLPHEIAEMLTIAGALKEYDDGKQWLDNDHAWDYELTAQIMAFSTGMFAIADDKGAIVYGPVRDLDKAERAKAGARVTFNVDVDVDEEGEPATDDLAVVGVTSPQSYPTGFTFEQIQQFEEFMAGQQAAEAAASAGGVVPA